MSFMRLSDQVKADIALTPQALNNSNITGPYFQCGTFRKFLFVLLGGAMAAGTTSKIELLQATDAAGTGAKGIPSDAGQEATATITANTKILTGTIDTTAGVAGNTLTIKTYKGDVLQRELTFTQAAATDAMKREFQNAAGLVTCINDPVCGVPGLFASAAGNVVTITVRPACDVCFTVTGHANYTLATVAALAWIELSPGRLDLANGYEYVAAKVTTTANTVVSVALIRGTGRWTPEQTDGAHALVD